MNTLRGKSLAAISKDIAEGYVTVNPLFLKPLERESLEKLYNQVVRLQIEIRGEKFPYGDVMAIRARNIKLQRLHNTLIIIKNFARERGMKNFLG